MTLEALEQALDRETARNAKCLAAAQKEAADAKAAAKAKAVEAAAAAEVEALSRGQDGSGGRYLQ